VSEPDTCVYCRKHPADPDTRPFCSERCRLLDLGAWIDGRYRVDPATPADDEDLDDPSPDGADET
jgi:uncharacterized protein